jgi:hypothetical protein
MAADPKDKQIPLALMGVGVLVLVAQGLFFAGAAGAGATLAALAVVTAIGTAIMVFAAIVTARLIGASFGELGSAVLKFAAIYVFAAALGSLIPFGGIVVFFVSLGLLMWLFELEMMHAVVFAVVLWVVNVVLAIAARAATA